MKPKNTDSTPCLIHALFLITLLAAAAGCVHVTVVLQNPPATPYPTGSNSTGGGTETETRAFYFVGPPPSGTFQTVQLQTVAIDGETTICSKPVTNFVVRFMTNQIPASGEVKFRGYLSNESASALVPNTDYVLQYWVSIANNGCCTNVTGTSYDVACGVTPGSRYKFYAHFYTGHAPASTSTFSLYGVFTP